MVASFHRHESSELELESRNARGFPEFESTLPNVKRAAPGDAATSRIEDIFSHLGRWNPMARPVSAKDTLWLLDNTAYRKANTNQWEAEFVAAVFQQDSGIGLDDVVAKLADKLGIAKDTQERETIRQRVDLFTREIMPGRKVEVAFKAHGLKKTLHLGPGGRNAISSDVKKIPEATPGELVVNKAIVPKGTDGLLEMNTVYAEPEGWAVISDVDDTIKITQTSSPLGILRSTFVSTPEPVAGMPELYENIKSMLSEKTPLFFYLSASPYNLYPLLRSFRDQYYPTGQIILREASWMNLAGLLSNLTLGVQDYKVDRITKIHSWVPNRKMICIGDSTQSDPEAFAETYKKFPGWIHLILIRKVEGIATVNVDKTTKPKRFEKAFSGLPETAWRVFETPDECKQIIANVMAGQQ